MRLRVRTTKLGKVRFVGHRDLGRVWDRALRRAGVPVAFTQGFSPRPRIAFGLALPMGAESLAEYVDVEIDEAGAPPLELAHLAVDLSALLPDGVDVTAVAVVERSAGSLQEIVTSCTWELWSDHLQPGRLDEALSLLEAASLPLERERKGERRVDDVRPLIEGLSVSGGRLVADLATTGRALRPSELIRLAYPDVDPLDVRVIRTHQWTSHQGERREVLAPSARPLVAAATVEVGA